MNGRLVVEHENEFTSSHSTASGGLCLGARCSRQDPTATAYTPASGFLKGEIDNARIHNWARTTFDVFEARYDFEDTPAGDPKRVIDLSPNEHDAILAGSAFRIDTGRDLNGLSLPTGGYAWIDDAADPVDMAQGFTVDAWIRRLSVTGSKEPRTIFSRPVYETFPLYSLTPSGRVVVVQRLPIGVVEEIWFGLEESPKATDTLNLVLAFRGERLQYTLPFQPSEHAWYHFGGVYDGRNLKLFFNGKHVAGRKVTWHDDFQWNDYLPGRPLIGAAQIRCTIDQLYSKFLAGDLDEFRLGRFPKDYTEDPDGDMVLASQEVPSTEVARGSVVYRRSVRDCEPMFTLSSGAW